MAFSYPVKGTVITINSTAIGQIQSVGDIGLQVGKRDVTHLGSAAKEYAPSIGDPQAISVSVIAAATDNGLQAFLSKVNTPSTALDTFSVILPTTTKTFGFSGFPSKGIWKFGDVEGTVMADLEIQPSGALTFPTS